MFWCVSIALLVLPQLTTSQEPELWLYFADQGETDHAGIIFKVNIGHMNFTSLVVADTPGPTAVAYDEQAEYVFWTDTVLKQIRMCFKDSTNDTVVAQLNTTSIPTALTLDSERGQLFYSDTGTLEIVRIEMDTFESTVIVSERLGFASGIVADRTNKLIYWTDRQSEDKIEACDYDGNNRRTVLSLGVVAPNGITLDERTGRLYWADASGHVESALVDGSQRRRVFTKSGVIFNGITACNGFLFLTMINQTFLLGMPEDGAHDTIMNSRKFSVPMGITSYSLYYNRSEPCADGFYGLSCEQCGNCFENRTCEKTTGACFGGCAPGYQSVRCFEVCAPGRYGERCSGVCGNCVEGGVCDHITGACHAGCVTAFRGERCDEECGNYTYGQPCVDCGQCANQEPCDNTTGVCGAGCQDGWEGDRCDQKICPPKTYGDCTPCGKCVDGVACDVNDGSCPDGCVLGWKGRRCDIACEGYTYGSACTPLGPCAGSACNNVTGNCPNGCVNGWTGSKCDQEVATTDREPSVYLKQDDKTGLIVGVVVAAVVVAVVVVGAFIYVRLRRGHADGKSTDMAMKEKSGVL